MQIIVITKYCNLADSWKYYCCLATLFVKSRLVEILGTFDKFDVIQFFF